MDVWRRITDFPRYLVSDRGLVCNDETGRILMQNVNQFGVSIVGLMRDGIQHKRSVAILVAREFLFPPEEDRFNTLIHLDGKLHHCFYHNLAWRPRPFAIAFHQQFKRPYIHRLYSPICLIETGEVFPDSSGPVSKYGVLERAVVQSAIHGGKEPVFPHGHRFTEI